MNTYISDEYTAGGLSFLDGDDATTLGNAVGDNTAGNALKGIGSGAAAGAAIGSIVPGIGTVIGGGVGAIIGGITSMFGKGDKSAWYLATGADREKLVDACIYKAVWVDKINPWDTPGIGAIQKSVFDQLNNAHQFNQGESLGNFTTKTPWVINHIFTAVGMNPDGSQANKQLHDDVWKFTSGQITTAPPFVPYANYQYPPVTNNSSSPEPVTSNIASPTTPPKDKTKTSTVATTEEEKAAQAKKSTIPKYLEIGAIVVVVIIIIVVIFKFAKKRK